MVTLIIGFFLLLQSCTGLLPIADDVEKMVDNDAIIIKVDKDAFQKDTDITISVDVKNKDTPK
jgi:hypothetical protein